MEHTYWLKQTQDNPLFPDLLWNRPENRLHAGKLLIIGGSSAGFRAPADAYRYTVKAGIGTARILLPDSLRKTVGEVFLELGEYAPSTPSGSFSYKSFAELLMHSQWADGVLLAGDVGRNSETAQLLEYYSNKYHGQLTVTGDALDFFLDAPQSLLARDQTVLVCTTAQLQKLAQGAKSAKPIIASLSMQNFAETLQFLASIGQCAYVTTYNDQVFIAAENQITSTPLKKLELELAAAASVWHLQNPSKTLQALTTAIL